MKNTKKNKKKNIVRRTYVSIKTVLVQLLKCFHFQIFQYEFGDLPFASGYEEKVVTFISTVCKSRQ